MKRNLPYLTAIIVANIIWAIAGPVIKLTLQEVPVFTFLLFRFLIVGIVMLPYALYLLQKNRVDHRDYLHFVILGILAQSSLAITFYAFKYTTALEGTIIGLLGPIVSVFAGHYYFNEKVDKTVKTGLLLATFGTLIISLEPMLAGHGYSQEIGKRLFGNFLMILSTLSFTLYIIWSKITFGKMPVRLRLAMKLLKIKPMKKAYDPLLLMTVSFYVGLATFIPFALMEKFGYFGEYSFSLEQIHIGSVLGILYMSLFSSIAAYLAFEWGLTRISVRDTAIYTYLSPIFTAPASYLLLGEVPTFFVILGFVVIAVGVTIAETRKT